MCMLGFGILLHIHHSTLMGNYAAGTGSAIPGLIPQKCVGVCIEDECQGSKSWKVSLTLNQIVPFRQTVHLEFDLHVGIQLVPGIIGFSLWSFPLSLSIPWNTHSTKHFRVYVVGLGWTDG